MSCIIQYYCNICKGLIEENVVNFSLVNENYEICRKCSEELEEKNCRNGKRKSK